MKVKDTYVGTHYVNLTEEQFNSMSKIEMINKILSDDVDDIIKYHNKFLFMKKNLFGSLFLSTISIFTFGVLGLFSIIPVIFFYYMTKKRKDNITWSIRTLKVNVAMFRGNGKFLLENDFIFENHLGRLDGIDIGELYDAISQK